MIQRMDHGVITMTNSTCTFETEMVEAVRTGQWPEALREHLAQCDICPEAVLVARMLQADREELLARLGDGTSPGQLWLRAEYERRLRHTRRRPWILAAACAAGVLAAIVVATTLLPVGQGILPPGMDLAFGPDQILQSPLTVIAAVLLLLVLPSADTRTVGRRR